MFDRIHTGSWWDIGLQLVEGCTKVSPGCDNCWSLTAANMRRFNPNPKMAARYEGVVRDSGVFASGPQWTGRVNPQWQDLDKIGAARKPQVYTFWNDLFHEGVPEEFIDQVLLRIQHRPQHFYIICTKRPERALKMFLDGKVSSEAIKAWNLMIMTTVENQEMADLRLPFLLQIPGVLHGISVEPGLGIVDFGQVICNDGDHLGPSLYNHGAGAGLDWLICGGETGPHARPMHPDIPRQLRDQCQAARVPFFFKAWGEWKAALLLTEAEQANFWRVQGKREWGVIDFEGNWFPNTTPWNGRQGKDSPEGEYTMLRVGKKTAGRILDGRTWDEVPEANKGNYILNSLKEKIDELG